MIERGRWIFDRARGELVPAEEFYARKHRGTQVSDLPCPTVISDYVDVKSMVDGQMYSSKSALRRSYRQHGVVEVGNEEMKAAPKPKPDRRAVRESIEKACSRAGISV